MYVHCCFLLGVSGNFFVAIACYWQLFALAMLLSACSCRRHPQLTAFSKQKNCQQTIDVEKVENESSNKNKANNSNCVANKSWQFSCHFGAKQFFEC